MTDEQISKLYDYVFPNTWNEMDCEKRDRVLAFARNVASYALGLKSEADLAEAKNHAFGVFVALKSAQDYGDSADAATLSRSLVLANERVAKLLAEPMPSYSSAKAGP